MTIQTLYGQFCHKVLEAGGLQLGLMSQAEFLALFVTKCQDFLQRTGIIQRLWVGLAELGEPKYTLPDWVIEPLHVFYNERLLNKSSLGEMDSLKPKWMTDLSGPRMWRNDVMKLLEFEAVPPPNRESRQIADPSSVTVGDQIDCAVAEPRAFYGTISGEPERVFYGSAAGPIYISRTNLAVIATANITNTDVELSDSIELIPDSFVHYILYAIMAETFDQDGELKDSRKAAYCAARYQEGINLANAIVRDAVLDLMDE